MGTVSKGLSPLILNSFKRFFAAPKLAAPQLQSLASNGLTHRKYATEVNVSELPPPAQFIKLSEGTFEDFKAAQEHFSRVASTNNTVDRWMNMIEVFLIGNLVEYWIFDIIK